MDPSPDSARSLDACLAENDWLRALARALVGHTEDAEDLVQDVYSHVTKKRHHLGAVRDVRAYLAGMLRFLASNQRRETHRRAARERHVATERDTSAPAAPAADDALERVDVMRQVLDELRRLPRSQGEIIALRYVEGLSIAQIATKRGQPASSVRSSLSRGLAALRERLDRTGGGRDSWLATLAPFTGVTALPASTPAPAPANFTLSTTASAAVPATVLGTLMSIKWIGAAAALCATVVGLSFLGGGGDLSERGASPDDLNSRDAKLESVSTTGGGATESPVSALDERSSATNARGPESSTSDASTHAAVVLFPVAGTIVDAITKEPVPAASVRVVTSEEFVPIQTNVNGEFEFDGLRVPAGELTLETFNNYRYGQEGRQQHTLAFPFEGPIEVSVGPTFIFDEVSARRIAMDSIVQAHLTDASGTRRHASTAVLKGGVRTWIRFPQPIGSPRQGAPDLLANGPWTLHVVTSMGFIHGTAQVDRRIGVERTPIHFDFEECGSISASMFAWEGHDSVRPILEATLVNTDDAPMVHRSDFSEYEGRLSAHLQPLPPGEYAWTVLGLEEGRQGRVTVRAREMEVIDIDTTSLGGKGRTLIVDASSAPNADLSDWACFLIDVTDEARHMQFRPRPATDLGPGFWRVAVGELPKGEWLAGMQPGTGYRISPNLLPITTELNQRRFVVEAAPMASIRVRVTAAESGEPLRGARGALISGLDVRVLDVADDWTLVSDKAIADRPSRLLVQASGRAMGSIDIAAGATGGEPFEIALKNGWSNCVFVYHADTCAPASGVSVHVDGEPAGVTGADGTFWLEGDGPPETLEIAKDNAALEMRFSASGFKGKLGDPQTGYMFLVGPRD